jgi:hypothetical protein
MSCAVQYDLDKMRLPSSVLVLIRLAFAGLLLALAVEIGRHSLGDALSESDPALSIVLDPVAPARELG